MKITKQQLIRIIKEEHAGIVSEALPQFQKAARAAGGAYANQGSSSVSEKIGDLEVVQGAFKGTAADRAKLKKELTSQVEKIKASGKEDTLPADVSMILARSDGDQLAALQKHINPGMFKKLGKLFGLSEGSVRVTRLQLRRIIREALNETRPRHGIDPKDYGRKVIHLRDGTSGVVVAVTRDIILLKSGEQIIPGQVDWAKTNRQ